MSQRIDLLNLLDDNEKHYTKTVNILSLLQLFGNKEREDGKRGLQLKDFRYALEEGYVKEQKKSSDGSLSSQQELYRNLDRSKKLFGEQLDEYYDKGIIQRNVFKKSKINKKGEKKKIRNIGAIISSNLGKLCDLGLVSKTGDNKNVYYKLKEDFNHQIIYQLRNMALIESYHSVAIKKFNFTPSFLRSDEDFIRCSVLLYGLTDVDFDQQKKIEEKLQKIEELFSDIFKLKLDKINESITDKEVFGKADNKKLLKIHHELDEASKSSFINVLIRYFLFEYPDFDKDEICLITIKAWMLARCEESEEFNDEKKVYDQIITKYKLDDEDLSKALERGINFLYEKFPMEIGFSLFYAPIPSFEELVEKKYLLN